MTYPYQAHHYLKSITLNVNDLEGMAKFYTEMVGLTVVKATDEQIYLGSSKKEAQLILQKNDDHSQQLAGLYHTAILVPDRNTLGLALHHLVINNVPLEGGADHGYSEAIYLPDPEGNGIEIYRDKPVSEWDIRDNGQIVGVTEELDAQSLVDNLVNVTDKFILPSETRIGHIHLSVNDADKTSKLYQKVFGFEDKFSIPSASWIASGGYHHHLAFNQWTGPNLGKRQEGQKGFNHMVIAYNDPILFQASLKKAKLYQMTILEESEQAATLEDFNGLQTKIILEN